MEELRCCLCGTKYDSAAEACPACGCPSEIIKNADSALAKYEEQGLLSRTENGTVLYGKYDQGNGEQPIEWQILMPYENALFLISKNILDYIPYHEEKVDAVSWENCSLRVWLEKTFACKAFTEDQLKLLATVELIPDANDGSLEYGAPAIGKPVFDTIFVLSLTEAMGTLSEMTAYSDFTEYSRKKAEAKDGEPGFWWTRTPGNSHNYAMSFSTDGTINSYGFDVTLPVGVRPALFIKFPE